MPSFKVQKQSTYVFMDEYGREELPRIYMEIILTINLSEGICNKALPASWVNLTLFKYK